MPPLPCLAHPTSLVDEVGVSWQAVDRYLIPAPVWANNVCQWVSSRGPLSVAATVAAAAAARGASGSCCLLQQEQTFRFRTGQVRCSWFRATYYIPNSVCAIDSPIYCTGSAGRYLPRLEGTCKTGYLGHPPACLPQSERENRENSRP